jgi:hypothetical protein
MKITSSHKFGNCIHDIVAIDNNHYLLASYGLLRTTKDKLIKTYYKGESVSSLSHVTDSFYLVGTGKSKLVVWNEQTE